MNYLLLAFIGVFVVFVLGFKKRKEAENNEKFLKMEKEGDFKGMKQMFGKLAVVWSIVAFLLIALSIILSFTSIVRGVTGLIMGVIVAYRDIEIIKRWKMYKRLEKQISYRMSEQEVEAFWRQDNGAISGGLYDYLFKKSYAETCLDMLNEKELMIYVLAKLEAEVNNGGFSQFFFNTEGKFDDKLVNYAYEVGASHIAKICENALDIVTRGLSEDETDELLSKECDDAFYASEDSLSNLCAEYARNHKEYFLS